MDAILLVLRTGMQWNALNASGICSSSAAHRRFQEWVEADVLHELTRLRDLPTTRRRRLAAGFASPYRRDARCQRRRGRAGRAGDDPNYAADAEERPDPYPRSRPR